MTAGAGPDAKPPLPCVLIGGWLGAGKTTLVNALLRQAGGRRLAVLVNDFGELGIDADLITGASDEVLELAGGCVCCSYGADLVGTLRRVAARTPRPDALLLETSGVADPAALARSLTLVPEIVRDGTVVLADAGRLAMLRQDPYVGDTVRAQLAAADLLVLNKADTLPPSALAALRETLPPVCTLDAVQAALPIELVLGLADDEPSDVRAGGPPAGRPAPGLRPLAAPGPAAGRFVSRSEHLVGPQDVDNLVQRLTAPGSGVLRAKGLLTDPQGRRWLLQVVGTSAQCTPAPTSAAGPDRLAVIGVAGLYAGAPWS
jgi:G3E family GTPase